MSYILTHANGLTFEVFNASETGDAGTAFAKATLPGGSKGDGGEQGITPNQGIQGNPGILFPGTDASPWGEVINENILKLYENFASTETAADTPDTNIVGTPIEGVLWFNTTQQHLYVYNGSMWLQIANTADIMSGGGGVAKNLIINPAFQIHQRAEPDKVFGESPFLPIGDPPNTIPGDDLGYGEMIRIGGGQQFESFEPIYFVDRWWVAQDDQVVSDFLQGFAQRIDTSGALSADRTANYVMRVGRVNGTDSAGVGRIMLGQTIANEVVSQIPNGGSVTLSFEMRLGSDFSAATPPLAQLWKGETPDEGSLALWNATWNQQFDVIADFVSATTSWQRFTYTTALTSTSLPITELALTFTYLSSVGNTADENDYFEVRNIKLEIGDSFTGFETPDAGDELAKCGRYFERLAYVHHVIGSVSGPPRLSHQYSTFKRKTPFIIVRDYGFRGGGHGGNIGFTARQSSVQSQTVAGEGSPGTWYDIVLDVDAEL